MKTGLGTLCLAGCLAGYLAGLSGLAAAQHAGHAGESRTAVQGGPGAAPQAPRSELGASAAIDAAGRLWAVRKEGQQVVLQHSDDRGANWSAPVPVNAVGEAVAADGDNRPKIAIGADGAIYVSWTSPLAKPYTGDIRFARSLDGGRSFDPPRTINDDRQPITHRFDSLAVDARGTVYLAWIDKRDPVAAKAAGGEYRGAGVYVDHSTDHGASFAGNQRLADHSCECCRIAIAPRPSGGADLMWRAVFAPNVRDHALGGVAADGRPEPARRATWDDWRIDACPHHGPSLARDAAGRLHAVWFTQGPGQEGVHYGRFLAAATGAAAPGDDAVPLAGRRVGGPGAAHADVAVSGARVAIAWKEFDGQQTRLRAQRSDDGGDTWRELDLLGTDGPSGQPQLLVDPQGFLVFWHTREKPLAVVALP